MQHLINYFPREIGLPYRLMTKDKTEFLSFINKNNGIKTVYYSLYDYPYEQCKIDKIHFDLDKEDALIALKLLHDYCKFENLKHLMLFSGNHYQFYIFACNYENINNKKDCLKNAQQYIAKQCNLTIGEPTKCDIDFHLIGDIARLVRVPNTMHLTTKLYAIPLAEEDISKGEAFIKDKAKQQQFKFIYYGDKLLDIKRFDFENGNNMIKIELNPDIESKIDHDLLLKKVPKCIANLLLMDYVHWRARYHIIIYLREHGYGLKDIINILRKYLEGKKHPEKGTDNFYHCFKEESNQIRRIYESNNYFFSCKKLKEEGYCIEGCKEKIYL